MADDLTPINFFYSDGTVTLVNGSDIAVGQFTGWATAVLPYDFLILGGNAGISFIVEVIDDTHVRLCMPWSGGNLTAVSYSMLRWIKHSDPRIFGVRVSDYLTKLRGIPADLTATIAALNAASAAMAANAGAAAAAQGAAETARGAAQAAQGAAETAYTGAQTAYTAFRSIYYGAFTADPTVDPNGAALSDGDLYYNTQSHSLRVRDASVGGTTWKDAGIDPAAYFNFENASETTVASAATTALGAVAAPRLLISGTTAITSFGSGAGASNANKVRAIRFGASLVLTHNVTSLILPGAANIITQAGDTAIAMSDSAGNWRVRAYQRADGRALVPPTPASMGLTIAPLGQCRLGFVSATSLRLDQQDGDQVFINGVWRTIPNAGIAAGNTGVLLNNVPGSNLAANTVYLVSVYDNAGSPALAYWTLATARTKGPNGQQIITGQPGHTVVGIIRTTAASQFADSPAQRLVASWFNPRPVALQGANTAPTSSSYAGVASISFSEVIATSRAEFVTFGLEGTEATVSGKGQGSTATLLIYASGGLDGAVTQFNNESGMYCNTANVDYPLSASGAFSPGEGYHFLTPLARVNNSTFSGAFALSVSATVRI